MHYDNVSVFRYRLTSDTKPVVASAVLMPSCKGVLILPFEKQLDNTPKAVDQFDMFFSESKLPLVPCSSGTFTDNDDFYFRAVMSHEYSHNLVSDEDMLSFNNDIMIGSSSSGKGGVLVRPWSDERESFFSLSDYLFSILDLCSSNGCVRECPVGNGSSGGGGGASHGGHASTTTTSGLSWVIGGGSSSQFLGGAAGSGDDDDPWKQRPPTSLTPSHYNEAALLDPNYYDFLPDEIDDLLRDSDFCDGLLCIGSNGLGHSLFNKNPSASIINEDPSDPMTPMSIMPYSVGVMHPSTPLPPQTPGTPLPPRRRA